VEDLVRWLSTQLDTDAEANASPYGEHSHHARGCASLPDVWGQETSECDCGVPARVLREIDRKRQLLAEYKLADAEGKYPDWAGGYASGLEYAVQLAAAEYADRPGYDPDWAPRSQWGPPAE
jgi:hypothetical protein